MHLVASLLLAANLAIPGTTLILHDGDHIDVDGPIREEHGRIIFKAQDRLYSIPLEEVDMAATRATTAPVVAEKTSEPKKLKVTAEERERLLRDLEQNHTGTPATAEQRAVPEIGQSERPQANGDEWTWRRAARQYQEKIRQAQEELTLLSTRAEQLKAQIAGFVALGYKPDQFTYQSTELQYTLEQIPHAQLDVGRATREWDQFRDDARRLDILPGWLR